MPSTPASRGCRAMARPVVLALDVGLTWCKAVALDQDGAMVASRQVFVAVPAYGLAESTAAVQRLWGHATEALRGLAAALPPGSEPVGLGVSAAAQQGLFLTADGMPFTLPAVGTRDAEATARAARHPEWGPEGMVAAGYAGYLAARLQWLWDHEPAWAARVARAGALHAYLMLQLTGRWCTDPATGPGRAPWPGAVTAIGRIDAAALPEVRRPEAVAGGLLHQVAAATGLPPGLAVAVGGQDGACANLGALACQPGDCCLTLSTNWVPRPVVGAPIRGAFGYPVGNGAWAWVRGAAFAGRQIDLAVAALDGGPAEVTGDRHNLLAAQAEAAGAPWPALPYLAPEQVSGQAARIRALRASGHSDGAIYAAAVRGSVAALLDRLAMARAEGCAPGRFVATGGFTRSRFVLRMLARALGAPVEVAADEAAARGAAACAAVGAGWHGDPETAAARLARPAGSVM